MHARVIAIMTQKGGVAKTTTALNLGAALAIKGRRVLLVDLDPQANLTRGINRRAADLSTSIYEYLTNPSCDPRAIVQRTAHERLDLVPSHIDLSGAELEMVTMIGRETRLKRALDILIPGYDYVLIDCLPSLSLLTLNAMVAAGEVVVPLQAHPFALEGLGKLFEIVGMIREALNPNLKVTGVMVTLYDSRTNVSRETLDQLRKDDRLAPHLYETLVRTNIKIAESQKDGVPVVHYDASCPGALAYFALCEELLEMESGCLASEARRRIRERAERDARRTAERAGLKDIQPLSPEEALRELARLGSVAAQPAPPQAAPHPEPAVTEEELEALLAGVVARDPVRARLGGETGFRGRLGLRAFDGAPGRAARRKSDDSVPAELRPAPAAAGLSARAKPPAPAQARASA